VSEVARSPLRRRYGVLTATGCLVAGILAGIWQLSPEGFDGLLFDSGLAANALLSTTDTDKGKVAVVAVDPQSLDSEELKPLPRAFFGPKWAELIQALTAAEAKVVAFDLLLTYTANSFQRGFDRPFLATLSRHRDRVVLGRSVRIDPARNYQAALRFEPSALGLIEVDAQDDGVLRHIPTRLVGDGGESALSLVGAALQRAGVGDLPDNILLAEAQHPETIPTYALIHVIRCAQSNPEAVARAFHGRVVFVGTNLPGEDRKRASARFIPPPKPVELATEGCNLLPLGASTHDADDVPGVHLHAVAAQAALTGNLVGTAGKGWIAIAAGIAAFLGAVASLGMRPWAAGGAVVTGIAVLWLIQTVALAQGVWVQLGVAMLALTEGAIIAYVVRFLAEERGRLRIQHAFGHYLAPAVVDRLNETGAPLRLGGDRRDVTIMFADLSGFTALSGILSPEALIEHTNGYLKLIADEVDATQGYVDKFIGDAVMAVWGAPADDPEHAANAVGAAVRIARRIAEAKEKAEATGEHAFDVKIGLNAGPAVVGNVGSDKRYDYTAVGEAVNIAARLESLPDVYKCRVVLTAETADRVGGRFLFRELDTVAVKGKEEPLRILEPIGFAGETVADAACLDDYARALDLYRKGAFAEAAATWSAHADTDGPSAVMAERARTFAANPPADWTGVWVMSGK